MAKKLAKKIFDDHSKQNELVEAVQENCHLVWFRASIKQNCHRRYIHYLSFFFNMKITQCIAYSNLNTDNAWIEHFVVIYESELFNEIPLKVKFLYNWFLLQKIKTKNFYSKIEIKPKTK